MNAIRLRRPPWAAALLLALAMEAQADVARLPPDSARPKQGAKVAKATFAGGCFWTMELVFDRVAGVLSTTSGYTGGTQPNPSYERVVSQQTDHVEAVEVVYDPRKVSYEQLVNYYWRHIDPTMRHRQFCDEGASYRTVIFTHDEEQLRAALRSKSALQRSKPFREPVVTEVRMAGRFYPAEHYHQDYYRKNREAYRMYSEGCGRAQRLQRLWGRDVAH